MERVEISVTDLVLRDADDRPVGLGSLAAGVHVVVLLRHRH